MLRYCLRCSLLRYASEATLYYVSLFRRLAISYVVDTPIFFAPAPPFTAPLLFERYDKIFISIAYALKSAKEGARDTYDDKAL